jgi:hypothetical protein
MSWALSMPKTARQLKAEIDSMWAPAVVPFVR